MSEHLVRALQASDYQSALAELRAALEELQVLEEPRRGHLEAIVWRDYSIVANRFGDVPTAIEYEEKLALRTPHDPYCYLALARLYGKLGNEEKAAESLRKCGELAEKCNDQRVLAALAAKGHLPDDQDARARRLADAVAAYRETLADRSLVSSSERYAGTQRALGTLYRAQADLLAGAARTAKLEEAAHAYREALKVYKSDPYPGENRALRESLAEVKECLKS
jgi:hypothetical protein